LESDELTGFLDVHVASNPDLVTSASDVNSTSKKPVYDVKLDALGNDDPECRNIWVLLVQLTSVQELRVTKS
jgi:hypothetical protein